MPRVGRHVRVTGRVQGVFFRAWTTERALALGVTGWVRNALDGSVEAQLEGEEAFVQQLIDQLKNGPPAARVEQIDVEPVDLEGSDCFEVRH